MQTNLNRELNIDDDSSISSLIASIANATKNTAIVLDFDETLFLRNSTAEYLDSLRPRWIGLIILKALYLIKPWLWLPKPFKGNKTEDWFLVFISTLLLPWTIWLWNKKAPDLASKYSNDVLINAVNQNTTSPVIIVSLGFNFIINPILKNMPIRPNSTIGCRFWQRASDRHKNKLLGISPRLPQLLDKSAIVVTSNDDLPLLKAVDHPYLITWSSAKYVAPLKNVYLPFFYLEKVKRCGEKYTLKIILWDDVPILLLAFAWQAIHPLLQSLSILFLLVSFWCVYELGYYENDYVAEKYEKQPKLALTYHLHKQTMQTWSPWVWSLVLGGIGVVLLEQALGVSLLWGNQLLNDGNSIFLPYCFWVGFLIVVRLCFRVYNYLNKHTRTWLYIWLQSLRYYGFLAVTSTNLIGTSLLSSNILSRSILYLVYRYSGGSADNWPKQVPEKLLRWWIFMFLLGAISLGLGSFELWRSWQTWAIVAWCLIRGQKQIIRMASQVKPIAKDGSNRVKSAS